MMHPQNCADSMRPTPIEYVMRDYELSALESNPSNVAPDWSPSVATPSLLSSASAHRVPNIPAQSYNGVTFASPVAPSHHHQPRLATNGCNYLHSGSPTTTTYSAGYQFPSPSLENQMPKNDVPNMDLNPGSESHMFSSTGRGMISDGYSRLRKSNNGRTWKSTTMCQTRHTKRKTNYEREEVDPPRKIRVNEEKMAARMQELHLDNNNLEWHPNLEEEPWFSRPVPDSGVVAMDGDEDDDKTAQDTCSPRLELSEELKLSMKTKDILPKLIQEEVNKSRMQVVLWKPPGTFVEDIKPSRVSSSEEVAGETRLSQDTVSTEPPLPQIVTFPPSLHSTISPGTTLSTPLFDSVDDEMEL